MTERKELQVGRLYRVRAEDCCVSVDLCGVFVGWSKDDDGMLDEAVFEFGAIWGHAWEAEEVGKYTVHPLQVTG